MKAIPETIGNTKVLIQAMDDDPVIIHPDGDETASSFENSGVTEDLKNAYDKAKTVIKDIAVDLGQELNNIREDAHVKQMEVEFSLGLSAEAKAWVIGAKADSALKVKLIWQADGASSF